MFLHLNCCVTSKIQFPFNANCLIKKPKHLKMTTVFLTHDHGCLFFYILWCDSWQMTFPYWHNEWESRLWHNVRPTTRVLLYYSSVLTMYSMGITMQLIACECNHVLSLITTHQLKCLCVRNRITPMAAFPLMSHGWFRGKL